MRIHSIIIMLFFGCLATPFFGLCQKPVKQFAANSFSEEVYKILDTAIGKNKTIPERYRKQILVALSYFPELAEAHIQFRIKHTYTPLASRPSWFGIFQKHKYRKYMITISDSSSSLLTPILLQQMEFNAQVGVLGHELSHVADFSRMHTGGPITCRLWKSFYFIFRQV